MRSVLAVSDQVDVGAVDRPYAVGVQYLGRGARGDDSPPVEEHDLLGEPACKGKVMGDHEGRAPRGCCVHPPPKDLEDEEDQ